MTETEREIRKIFLGRTILMDDGKLSVAGPDDIWIASGVSDGALGIRILGVGHKAVSLQTSLGEEETKEKIQKAMKDIGRGLFLPSQPEVIGCLLRFVLTKPAILTFTYREGVPVLTVWAGRGATAWLARKRALSRLKKKLPEEITYTEDAAPEEPQEEKAPKKKRPSAKERKEEKAKQKEEALRHKKEQEQLAEERAAQIEAFGAQLREDVKTITADKEDK